MTRSLPTLLVVLGNEFRSDDGIGRIVAEKMQSEGSVGFEILCHNGEPTDLMERWHQRDTVIIDALVGSEGDATGDLKTIHPLKGDELEETRSPSSHAASLAEALAWGRSLGKLPHSLVVVGVVGENFEPGTEVSPAVAASIPQLIERLKAMQTEEKSSHA